MLFSSESVKASFLWACVLAMLGIAWFLNWKYAPGGREIDERITMQSIAFGMSIMIHSSASWRDSQFLIKSENRPLPLKDLQPLHSAISTRGDSILKSLKQHDAWNQGYWIRSSISDGVLQSFDIISEGPNRCFEGSTKDDIVVTQKMNRVR